MEGTGHARGPNHRRSTIRARVTTRCFAEQDDEWQDGRRYFLPESMARIDAVPEREEAGPVLLMAS